MSYAMQFLFAFDAMPYRKRKWITYKKNYQWIASYKQRKNLALKQERTVATNWAERDEKEDMDGIALFVCWIGEDWREAKLIFHG